MCSKINVVMTKSGDWWWLSNREAVCVWRAAGWDDGKMCVGPHCGTSSECQDQAESHEEPRVRGNDLSVVRPAPPALTGPGSPQAGEGHNIILIITSNHNIRPILLIRNSHRNGGVGLTAPNPLLGLIPNKEAPVVGCHMTVCTHQGLSHAVDTQWSDSGSPVSMCHELCAGFSG